MNYYRSHILIGMNETSLSAGAKEFEIELRKEITGHQLQSEINILETGPLSFFGKGICLTVFPENTFYSDVKIADIPELVSEHFLKGRILKRLVFEGPLQGEAKLNYAERIVLDNSGLIDPENIDEYVGRGGYEALEKALLKMKPLEVLDEVKKSGLRGRGGAGFPTGLKWSFTAPIQTDQKYVVINADEGEPGTFKDRLIMEGDPHKLLEGIALCAYSIGANKAYIYIRGEYNLCIERLRHAIKQANEYGLLGKNIFGTDFSLDIDIKIGAGAYVCGEETALIESLEGNRGNPRWKPPFPGVEGLWKKPTVVNNVETIASVPYIIKNGAEAFAKRGTPDCTGTKVFTILGEVAHPGLCEVDMGTTMRSIINEYGGGMKKGIKFKAALIGGAAGVFLPDSMLDVKMDFTSLNQYAAVLGSGAVLVMNENTSIVDMLYSILKFFKHESCGKCSPCRIGTQELYGLIVKIKKGNGTKADLDQMELLAEVMKQTSFCALGQSPIMPIQSAFEHFKDEFLALVQ